jgi:membrane-bound lytic murein transglycosylase B
VGVPVRRLACAIAAAASAAVLGACGGAANSTSTTPGSNAAIPTTSGALAGRLSTVAASFQRGVAAWHADGNPRGAPPDGVTSPALYLQRTVDLLARQPGLEAATSRRLSPRLAGEIKALSTARRDLHRLSAGWPTHRVVTGPPDPVGELLRSYRAASGRFGVRWQVLASVNLVESAFGRVRNPSVAGARGPMQFMPATWRTYGLGGDVNDPRDAILAAANLLHHAGAPTSYARALYAYNPSPHYVDAVQRYARVMSRDRNAVYLLYSWRP